MLPNLRGVQILHRSCRPALICLLFFWTGNTVSNLIMILPPICGAIQTFRDGLEFRYICSFLGLAGLSVESTNYLALYRWQYLSKLSSCSSSCLSSCLHYLLVMLPIILHTCENFLTFSLLFYGVLCVCRTAVGVGSWCFHMTLLYEMQVGYNVELKT